MFDEERDAILRRLAFNLDASDALLEIDKMMSDAGMYANTMVVFRSRSAYEISCAVSAFVKRTRKQKRVTK